MTTKRKLILKAIAIAGSITIDDLIINTGLQRKNLHDNIKAAMLPVPLLERIRDDVTGLPAYRLTKQGREWLENDKDDSRSAKPTATKPDPVVKPNLTTEPVLPAHDQNLIKDAQRNAELEVRLTSAGGAIVEFCEWLAKKVNVRCPMNLHECKAVITDAMQSGDLVSDLEALTHKQAAIIKSFQAEVETKTLRIAALEGNAELPLSPAIESNLGYTVMEFSDDDIEKNILELDAARDKAATNTLRTGNKTAVFAVVDRVENVTVAWAA